MRIIFKMRNFFVLFVFVVLFSACIQVDAYIEINEDGSGRMKISYIVNKGIYGAPDEAQLAINEDRLAEILNQKEGVEVIKIGSEMYGDNVVKVWADFKFKKIEKISDSFLKYEIDDLKDKKEFRVHYKYKGQLHKKDVLKSFFKGLDSKLQVKFPGKVISTNGEKIGENEVMWIIKGEEIVGTTGEKIMIATFETKKKKRFLFF